MKEYIKSGGILYQDYSGFKIYPSEPVDLSDINDDEVIFVTDVGIYQKRNSELVALSSSGSGGGGGSVGDIVIFYGNSTISNPDPDHLILCDGRQYDTTEFSDLYTLLGTNTVPNLVGYHLKGVGENSNFSTHDAITLNTKVVNSIPNHTHSICNPQHCHSVSQGTHYHCVAGWGACRTCLTNFGYCEIYKRLCSTSVPTSTVTSQTNNYCSVALCNVSVNITIGNPSTATSYSSVRSGSETKPKDKTVYFLIRGKS